MSNPYSKGNYVPTGHQPATADPAEEQRVRTWVSEVCPQYAAKLQNVSAPLHGALQSGVVLCTLANALQPGIVPSSSIFAVDGATASFKQMENIAAFLRAVRALGVREFELFTTAALFHARDLRQVVICILALQRVTDAAKAVATAAAVPEHPMGPAVPADGASKPLTAHAQEHFHVVEKEKPDAVVAKGFVPFAGEAAAQPGAFDAKAAEFATHTQASAGTAPPISEQEMRESRLRLDNMHHDKDRLTIIRALATNFSFTCAQLANIVQHAHFGGGGIEAAALLWPNVTDKEARETVLGAFKFADETEAVRAKLLELDSAAAAAVVPKYYEVGNPAGAAAAPAPPWAAAGGTTELAAVSPWAKTASASAPAPVAPPAVAPFAAAATPAAAAASSPFGAPTGGGGGWSWNKAKKPTDA